MERTIIKRRIEVFTADCPVCEETVTLVQSLACPSCEMRIERGAPRTNGGTK